MRKKLFLGVVALLLAVALPIGVKAASDFEDNVFIPQDKTIEYNYFKAANLIDVSGTLEKDAVLFGNSITIDGNIKGDLFCLTNDLRINGTIDGNVRCAAQNIIINGKVAKNANLVGTSVSLGDSSEVGWELLAAGSLIDVNGKVGGNTNLAGAKVTVNNEINGWLFANVEGGVLELGDNAKINGTVSYTADKSEVLQASSGAQVMGETKFNLVDKSERMAKNWQDKLSAFIWSLLGNLIIAIIIIAIAPKFLQKVGEHITKNFGKDFGFGLLFLFATPIACLIAAVTVIGLPLSIISLVLYFILFYLGKIFFGLAVAYWAGKLFKFKTDNLWLAVLLGLIAVLVFKQIPVIGWIVSLVAMASGFGGFLFVKKEELK
jgi:hypothetical protein